MAIFSEDSFTDTDGTRLADHTPDLGAAWVKEGTGSTEQITGNRLKWNSLDRDININYSHVIDVGKADVDIRVIIDDITYVIITGGSPEVRTGIRFRQSDNDNFITLIMFIGRDNTYGGAQGKLLLRREEDGIKTNIGSSVKVWATNDPGFAANGGLIARTMRVLTAGESIKTYLNETLIHNVNEGFNKTVTRHGLFMGGDDQATQHANLEVFYDDWKVASSILTCPDVRVLSSVRSLGASETLLARSLVGSSPISPTARCPS